MSLFGAGPYDVSKEREGDIPFEEQLRGLQDVVQAGKVRYVGVSNETSYGVMRFVAAAEAAGLPRIVSIQNAYSLLVRGAYETDLAEVCAPRQCDVGLLAYSPLAGGALSGKVRRQRLVCCWVVLLCCVGLGCVVVCAVLGCVLLCVLCGQNQEEY